MLRHHRRARAAAVAGGFERLDRRRDRIAELEGDVAELADLGRRQRAYAVCVLATVADGRRRVVARRRGAASRTAVADRAGPAGASTATPTGRAGLGP